MTIWPNGLKWVPVSTTVNPVTQVALVAVNDRSRRQHQQQRAYENRSRKAEHQNLSRGQSPSSGGGG
jgi:hypothetical protein